MFRETPLTVVRGFFMGAADIVPGVSGGTIALLFGIYRRLVASIRAGSSALGHLVRLDWSGTVGWLRRVEWGFLLPLLAGIGIAVVTLAGVLETLLEDHPVPTSAAFFGLIAGSIYVVWALVTQQDRVRISIAVAVGIAVFVLLGVTRGTSEEAVSQLENPAVWAFFAAGALAICAMILPGISGSFILVLLGMYSAVLGAVNDRDLVSLAVFLAGATLGLALFSQVLHWALTRYYDSVVAGLIGLMAGSVRVLWPWPDGLDSTELGAPSGSVPLSIVLAVAAAVGVVLISDLSRRAEARSAARTGRPAAD